MLAFAFLTCEPDQRKRKRKVKNTRSRAFRNILFFSTKAAVIFNNKLKKQMAKADVASEVGLQKGKCCDKKGKSCLFRKISRTHKRLGLDLLFLFIRRLRLIRRIPRKRKNNNTNTSWNTRLRLRIALCLRLRWTCELPCACVCVCVCVCVARVNQPFMYIPQSRNNHLHFNGNHIVQKQ